ncbi:MAG TPA: lytic murein transglycosylase [Solirubrobacteraceae bacterium]|jgi:murein DD-endopeptidase MepM/ murein hydrolase activator NlpD|nr:lytic murein transglycosylase [Solirubrobacteraceae bacterium]
MSEDTPDMKAHADGSSIQRASRLRIAVALCTAGLVTGTLGNNLVGAGADNPPPVPGETVPAPPKQIASDGGSPAARQQTSTTPDAAALARTTPQDPPATTTPAPTDPPAPEPTPDAPAPTPSVDPAATPAATATSPTPSAQAPATKPQPSDAPMPLGGIAGAPQPADPETTPCPQSTVARTTRRGRPVVGAKRAILRAARSACKVPAPHSTTAEPSTGAARGRVRDPKTGRELRNAHGVPTLANPSTSLSTIGPAAIGVPNFFIDKFRIPVFLLPIYQAAGIQYGVRWEILAAINEIETDYGRYLNVSSAGALGWMQFMPPTWKSYGVDANRDGRTDPFNPVDAIFAAARYLKAAGADQDLRKAIFAYNHADWYVNSVLVRARLIGGMPSDLVGSLSGLTQGQFPVYAKARYADDLAEHRATRRVASGTNAAMPVESDVTRRGIDIFAAAGSPVIAVQDGRVVALGRTKRLGNFVRLTDVYGNTYTYGHLKKLADRVPVAKDKNQSKASIARELELPKADPTPTRSATAGRPTHDRPQLHAPQAARAARDVTPLMTKERLFAHPARKNSLSFGGARQLLELRSRLAEGETLKSYFTGEFGLDEKEFELRRLVPGTRVIAGTILGRIGTLSKTVSPHVHFEIKPAGRGAPRIDPKPILDGWKLLEATSIYRAQGANPLTGAGSGSASIGQIMLMSKEVLAQRVLSNPRIEIYSCGRRDIEAGGIDRRVLATLEFLAASGLKPTVTSLHCGHSYLTASGNVSEHSAGSAVDIAMINGIPIVGHQGEGSITDITIRRLLTLQGISKPHQIISLMTYAGTDNTLALADHADHIHVGFHPEYAAGTPAAKELATVLKPSQWIKLIDRLGQINNPTVAKKPSKYAIAVPVPQASTAHHGE